MATQPLLLTLALALGSAVATAPINAEPQIATNSASTETTVEKTTVEETETAILSFDQIFQSPRIGKWPRMWRWNSDGSRLGYLIQDGEDGEALSVLDVASGTSEVLLRSSDLPQDSNGKEAGQEAKGPEEDKEKEGEAARSIDGYHFSPAGNLLIESDGELFSLSSGGTLKRLIESSTAPPQDLRLAPNGTAVAYVRDQNLYWMELKSGKEKALTRDGKKGEIFNGQTDWVYWEEIHGRSSKGFWWSGDSQKLAYYRFDDRKVPLYTLLDSMPLYPTVKKQRYPKAGETNPKVRVGVIDITKRRAKTVWLDTHPAAGEGSDVYLARVTWMPDHQHVAVQRLNRQQNRLDLLKCSALDGSCSTLLTDTSETWINLGDELRFLADGRFIWSSEETGWKHLYLHAADGSRIRPLTQGQWSVTSLDAVDEKGDRVIFTAPASPSAGYLHREVYEASLGETMKITPLTNSPGWHGAMVAPGAKYWLHTVSSTQKPPSRSIVGPDGLAVAEVPASTPPTFDPSQLPDWELHFIWGLSGARLPARLLKPAHMEEGKKYPVIMYHYGCPASQTVVNRWGGARDLWHKMMAQRGYVIFGVDNTASAFFGKRGEDAAHLRFGPINLRAQTAGVEFLKTLPFVDIDRIGIWGWSGGGSNTLAALLSKPGVWKAGVAGAPVTDWHLYDTVWTERYLGHPEDNPEGYEQSSPLTLAADLEDHLLIVHGTADDNVHPQNTLVMSEAFIKAGVPFEQAIYPGQKHGFRGKSSRHFYERMTEFFDRWLAEEE